MRIAKWIAANSKYSRREAERLIFEGFVTVDDSIITTPAFFIEDANRIAIKGVALNQSKKDPIILLYNKPEGFVVSSSPCFTNGEEKRPVFDHFPKTDTRWITIGRLDIASEGLLLATNIPQIAHDMESPKSALKRTYRVRTFGRVDETILDKVRKGPLVEGIKYKPCEVEIESISGNHTWLLITITEGKNREIRRMLNYVGLMVSRLIRISFGEFQLGDIKSGKCVIVNNPFG